MKLDDIKTKYYPDIDNDIFWDIVRLDPTYNAEKPQKRGMYTSWLLTLYQQDKLWAEDYTFATEYLSTFHAVKQRLEHRDIGYYRELPDLYDVVAPYLEQKPETRNSIKHDEAEKLYEDDEWTIVIPHTWEASKLYGAGTQWCTASRHSDYFFKSYTASGTLYININRYTGNKYQMLVSNKDNTYQYCYDKTDRKVFSGNIGLSKGAIDFYNSHIKFDPKRCVTRHLADTLVESQDSIDQKHFFGLVDNFPVRVLDGYHFESFKQPRNGMIRCCENQLGRCMIDLDSFEVISVKACDFCDEFVKDYATAWRKNKVGVIDRQGVFTEGVDQLHKVVEFCNGMAPIRLCDNKYNFIDKQGNLIFDYDFNWCGTFHSGFCKVVFDNHRKGYVSSTGSTLVLDKEVVAWSNFSNGIASVRLDNGFNIIRTDGSYVYDKHALLIENWGDAGIRRVTLANGHYTFYDTYSGLFTDLTFRDCRKFVMGLAAVVTEDGRWNFLKPDGQLLLGYGVNWCSDFDRNWCAAKIETYRGNNMINTDGELLQAWPKLKTKRHTRGSRLVM